MPRPSRFAILVVAATLAGCAGGASPSPAATSSPPTATPSERPVTASPSSTPEGSATPATSPPPAVQITWSPVAAAGTAPSAREDHTWTVDPATATAFLFGGRNGSEAFGDLYAYDLAGDAWARLDPVGSRPPARFGHEAAWVPGVGVVIFAGQASASEFFGDLWAYDPAVNRWTLLPGDGEAPVPRYGSCSGVGPDGRLWISHGFTEDGARFADTRAYDFNARLWTDETPVDRKPIERCLHGCFFTDDGRFVLYGGQTTGVVALGDLWALATGGSSAEWEQHKPGLPADRNLYAFARHRDSWIVFGGRGADGFLDDAYRVDGATLEFEPLTAQGDGPDGRSGATLVSDADRGRVLLFGGTDADSAFDDTWALAVP